MSLSTRFAHLLSSGPGIVQLDKFVKIKRSVGRRYPELLAGLDRVQLPLASTDYAARIHWVFGLVINDDKDMTANPPMTELQATGISCRHFFYPMHQQLALLKRGLFNNESLPVFERLSQKYLYIPSGMKLNDQHIERTAAAAIEVLS